MSTIKFLKQSRSGLMILFSGLMMMLLVVVSIPSLHAQGQQICSSSDFDSDGDGYGWEDTDGDGSPNSCLVVDNPTTGPSTTPTPAPTPVSDPNECIDTDGDGYGWDGSATCIPDQNGSTPTQAPTPTTPTTNPNAECIDTDGDGFGWDGMNTCIPGQGNSNPVQTNPVQGGSRITDIILAAGQSNATGQNSRWDIFLNGENLGASQSNILVWVPDAATNSNQNPTGANGRWLEANLCSQNWYVRTYHSAVGGGGVASYPSRGRIDRCQNHPAFQIAKQIIARSNRSRTIGIIATGLPGTSITQWASGRPGRQEIDVVANAALRAANVANSDRYVKYVAWAQGENDAGLNSYYSNFENLVNHWKNQNGGNNWLSQPGNTGRKGIIAAQYIRASDTNCVGITRDPNSIGGISLVNSGNRRDNFAPNTAFNTALIDTRIIDAVVDTTNACTAVTDSRQEDPTHYNTLTLRRLGEVHANVFNARF